MARDSACTYASPLRSFSRWLFAKNKPSLVAQVDSKSLSGDVSAFIGKGNPGKLLRAIDHLRTFRSAGAPIVGPRAKLSPQLETVVPINPESAVLMEPRLIGGATAQPRPSREASSRLQELREGQEDQSAPSAFVQERVAFDPEQTHQWELRRVLDYLAPRPRCVSPPANVGKSTRPSGGRYSAPVAVSVDRDAKPRLLKRSRR